MVVWYTGGGVGVGCDVGAGGWGGVGIGGGSAGDGGCVFGTGVVAAVVLVVAATAVAAAVVMVVVFMCMHVCVRAGKNPRKCIRSSRRDNWPEGNHLAGLELYYHCAMGVYWHLIIFQVPRLTRCMAWCGVVWCGMVRDAPLIIFQLLEVS